MDFCHTHPGGAEVELSMLFVDVRGSSQLARQLGATAFGKLMNRFYKAASEVLVETDAYVDKFVGDEVIGLYLPVFTGNEHAALAIDAARRILRATGHQGPEGAWVPVGVGVHTGISFPGISFDPCAFHLPPFVSTSSIVARGNMPLLLIAIWVRSIGLAFRASAAGPWPLPSTP